VTVLELMPLILFVFEFSSFERRFSCVWQMFVFNHLENGDEPRDLLHFEISGTTYSPEGKM